MALTTQLRRTHSEAIIQLAHASDDRVFCVSAGWSLDPDNTSPLSLTRSTGCTDRGLGRDLHSQVRFVNSTVLLWA